MLWPPAEAATQLLHCILCDLASAMVIPLVRCNMCRCGESNLSMFSPVALFLWPTGFGCFEFELTLSTKLLTRSGINFTSKPIATIETCNHSLGDVFALACVRRLMFGGIQRPEACTIT